MVSLCDFFKHYLKSTFAAMFLIVYQGRQSGWNTGLLLQIIHDSTHRILDSCVNNNEHWRQSRIKA